MSQQELTQLKVIALQAASGDLVNARAIFEWLTEAPAEVVAGGN